MSNTQNLYSTIYSNGIYLKTTSLREFYKASKLLEKLGVPYSGQKDKLHSWLTAFGKPHYIIYTIPYKKPLHTAGRIDVFFSVDKKEQVEITMKDLQNLVREHSK